MIGTFEDLASIAPGFVGQLMAHDHNIEAIRAHTLAKYRAHTPMLTDIQKLIDTTVVQDFQAPLNVTRRLIANGQVFLLRRPFAHSEISHHIEKKLVGARMSRNPAARVEQDMTDLIEVKTPVYFTLANIQIPITALETSRNMGVPLDTDLVRQKARNIAETIEEVVIRGKVGTTNPPQVGGNTAKGLENAPNINPVTLTKNWDAADKTVIEILADVQKMFDALDDDNQSGPVDLFIPRKWMNAIRFKQNANTDRTAIEILKGVLTQDESRPVEIRSSDKLSANTAIMYARNPLVVDLILGDFGGPQAPDDPNSPDDNPVPITVIPWEEPHGLALNWILIAAVIPRPKSTHSGQSGIVKLAA